MRTLLALFVLLLPVRAWAFDSALFAHCVQDWSAAAVGDTWCGVAIEAGYPTTAPFPQRSCARAYDLGVGYFALLNPQKDEATPVLCATFASRGAAVLPEW